MDVAETELEDAAAAVEEAEREVAEAQRKVDQERMGPAGARFIDPGIIQQRVDGCEQLLARLNLRLEQQQDPETKRMLDELVLGLKTTIAPLLPPVAPGGAPPPAQDAAPAPGSSPPQTAKPEAPDGNATEETSAPPRIPSGTEGPVPTAQELAHLAAKAKGLQALQARREQSRVSAATTETKAVRTPQGGNAGEDTPPWPGTGTEGPGKEDADMGATPRGPNRADPSPGTKVSTPARQARGNGSGTTRSRSRTPEEEKDEV